MITAFVLVNVEPGRLKQVAESLLELPGVYEVYSVAGPYDLIAIARITRHDELSDLVSDRIGPIDGIEATETMIAFRTYAKRDPGLLWDVGGSEN